MTFLNKISDIYWIFIKKLNSIKILKPIVYLLDVETYKNPTIQRLLMFVTFVTVLAIIMVPEPRISIVQYKEGDPATKEITAPRDYIIVDKEATDRKKTEAINNVLPIFDIDGTVPNSLFDKTELAFNSMRKISNSNTIDGNLNTLYDENKKDFFDVLGVKPSDTAFEELKKLDFENDVDKAIKLLIESLSGYYILLSDDIILSEIEKNGVILINSQTKSKTYISNSDKIIDIERAKEIVKNKAKKTIAELPRKVVTPALEISLMLIKPNVTYNLGETDKQKELAIDDVVPVTINITKGQTIVERRQEIDKENLMILDGIIELEKDYNYNILLAFLGILIFVSVLVLTTYTFAINNVSKFKSSNKDLLLYILTFLFFLVLTKFAMLITSALGNQYENIPESAYKFVIPIIAGTMLIRIVMNSESAIFYAVLSTIFSGIILGDDILFMTYLFIGSLLGAHLVAQTKQRSTILYAGLIVGLTNVFLILLLNISNLNILYSDVLSSINTDPKTIISAFVFSLLGFSSAIISSILVLGVTPVVELLFGYTTDIKLVELSNLDHPLLRDLVIRAPGTYHHSIIVGSLAEAGATAIGANPLLARVSAYYHDIGKIKKPNYFIENISSNQNPHDKLSPHMSSLILISHVKDGVELAKKHKLGDEIIDVIQQHHGTHLINFFYQKALESDDGKGNPVDEKSFRYPGPKPQNSEAGLVLLADNVEAASKVLTDPKPARVEAMVKSIIERLFLDGQLGQCELTLKDLDAISNSFIQVLNGIFHQRIEYPEPVIDHEKEEVEEKESPNGDGPNKKRDTSKQDNNRSD